MEITRQEHHDSIKRINYRHDKLEDAVNDIKLAVTKIMANSESQADMVAKMFKVVFGNGEPGLATRIDRNSVKISILLPIVISMFLAVMGLGFALWKAGS